MTLSTPIVFLIYRRPSLTQQVFNEIAKAKPQYLFVVADGAKTPEDEERCQATRAIIKQVNWDCEVKTNYADKNMGLRLRISSGLNWVFEQVERAIILEDDCVPHPTFFRFCEEILEKYQDDEQVMHISGDNFGYKRPTGIHDSYYFSMYAHVWGWATWRRAWSKYDVNMDSWGNETTRQQILSTFHSVRQQRYWSKIWDGIRNGIIKTWDYQWMYACIKNHGLSIMPYENQISNIGIGAEGTNTKNTASPVANLPTYSVSFPLNHPSMIRRNIEADTLSERLFFRRMTLLNRAKRKIKTLWTTFTKR